MSVAGDDVAGFFARRDTLDPDAYLELEFTFECAGDPRVAAAHLCSEQSTAQWKRSGVAEDFRPVYGAKVLELESTLIGGFSLELPGVGNTAGVHRCRAVVAHPHGNFGPRIPNLLSAILGEGVFFAPDIPIVRLEEVRFPDPFLAHFQGPQFGIAGLRDRLQAFHRPIFLGVVKPNIGLTPAQFAPLAYEGWMGGLDIAKDDEMLADTAWSPSEERTRLLGELRRRAERETGVPKCYLANITDEVDRLVPLHDLVTRHGANAVMVNAMPTGLSAVRMLRKHATVPLVAHFPMLAGLTRVPQYGVHPRVFTRLQRLAGYDVVIMPGFGPRMCTPEADVRACLAACTDRMGHLRPALPVPGGSDSAATLAGVHRKVGSVDFGFVPGRGVFAHPEGPRAGAKAIRDEWDRISSSL